MLLVAFGTQVHAADYYWVGGGGTWSDLNHWRLNSSAGPIPSIVPGPGDNVFFDANSGFGTTAPTRTVTLGANALCNDMTWGNVPNSPIFTTANAAFTVQIHGSLSMNPTTYYQVIFSFSGNSNATITSNGTIGGEFGMNINKGTGSLTVTDSLVAPLPSTTAINSTTFTSGTFNIAGKKVVLYSFGSQNDNVRTLEMTNATVICNSGPNSGFKVTGLNKTVNALGSTVVAFGYNTDEGIYNRTTITSGNGPNTVFVNNSTFKTLTFSPGAGYVYPNIGTNNTIDTVLFNGIGTIGSNNNVGYVRFANTATISGTGNVIGKMVCQNALTVGGGATTTTVDSLTLAPNRSTIFFGTTFNINDYLFVAGAPCEAYTEIFGNAAGSAVNFASGAVVDINNVILTNVTATGPVTPVAVNGIDGGGNTGFTITEPSGMGTTLYWVGGAGDWNNKSHWSFTSGGTGGACVPFKSDNVVFDNNSGLAGATVTTSSSSFCKDITWAPGVGTTTFNESTTASLRVYGSATLQSGVTMNATLEFYDTTATTLTTNGGGSGSFSVYVYKTGNGSLTLTDNWINAANGNIVLASGGLNMAGRTVSLWTITSSGSALRSLDISNATITANLRWIYQGGNKSMTSTGSQITANGSFRVNNPGSTYPSVTITQTASENTYEISGTAFGQLTFTNPSVVSAAAIQSGNTLRRLEFKGAGSIGLSTNNAIDSLILTGSRNYIFRGTTTINNYFKAESIPCDGLLEMRSGNGTAVLAFQPAADVHVDNVYLQSMAATGVMTPIAINGADAGGNSGWTITPIAGGSRYWVGGAGDWNQSSHWSTTSGGAGGACVPTVSNDVFFDAASGFTAGSKTVTVNNGNAYCRSVNWTGAANAPIWSQASSWSIEVWGDSIVLNPAATFNAAVVAKGTNAAFLKGSVLGNFDVYIDKPGSSFTMLNNYSNTATDFGLMNGALNASGLTLNISGVDNTFGSNAYINNVFAVNISNSTINAAGWRFIGNIANHTLNAANSAITTGIFYGNQSYDTVNVSGNLSTHAGINSATINRLIFTNTSTTSTVGINGAGNTLGYVEYKGSGGVYGTGNTINTLVFFPGKIYTFTAGTTTTITGNWFGSGTPCNLTEIVSSSASANATINKTGGAPEFDYMRLRRITATGSTPFVANEHTIDQGNNSNWSIAPYNGASPIYGLGPDTLIAATAFPYTLHTDGFFGSPSSQYTWNNSSTADSLVIPGPGTYSVNVGFVDGCNISDQITIGLFNPLPVDLISFSANKQGCYAHLNWKVANTADFSHFAVERSTDGRNFTTIAQVPNNNVTGYAYTDLAPKEGLNHYRLKLVDINTRYSYSKTVSTNIACGLDAVKVYPTVTSGRVQIELPKGYDGAKIQLHNSFGQSIDKPVSGSGTLRTIDLDGLPNALYLLQVVNGNEIKSFKIYKQ